MTQITPVHTQSLPTLTQAVTNLATANLGQQNSHNNFQAILATLQTRTLLVQAQTLSKTQENATNQPRSSIFVPTLLVTQQTTPSVTANSNNHSKSKKPNKTSDKKTGPVKPRQR